MSLSDSEEEKFQVKQALLETKKMLERFDQDDSEPLYYLPKEKLSTIL